MVILSFMEAYNRSSFFFFFFKLQSTTFCWSHKEIAIFLVHWKYNMVSDTGFMPHSWKQINMPSFTTTMPWYHIFEMSREQKKGKCWRVLHWNPFITGLLFLPWNSTFILCMKSKCVLLVLCTIFTNPTKIHPFKSLAFEQKYLPT